MSVLQAAIIVGLSPAFLAAFYEPTFFGILTFRKSRNSSIRHGSVSEIPTRKRTLEFLRPLMSKAAGWLLICYGIVQITV